jgi:hypothetical protein
MSWTNLGKQKMFEATFGGSSLPNNFCLQLSTSASDELWDADLKSTSSLTLVSEGNGYYASGLAIERDGVDFVVTVNDSFDNALVTLRSGYEWVATGGSISNIQYVLLTAQYSAGDNPASREVWAFWDLGSTVSIPQNSRFVITSAALQGS